MDFKRCLVRFLNTIVPKDEKLIVFSSKPDFAESTKNVYDYIKNDPAFHDYKLVWITSGSAVSNDNTDEVSYYKNTKKAIWNYVRAKYVFSSHGLYARTVVDSQIHVGLWHGMALKRIKDFDRPTIGKREFTISIATSQLFKGIMARCFSLDEDNIKVLGLPRNDDLLHPDNSLKKLGIAGTQTVIFWLPTFRTPKNVSAEHGVNKEGADYELGIPFWNSTNIESLDQFLQDNSIILVIKIHMLQKIDLSVLPALKNIIFLMTDECTKLGINLYKMLGCGDALITDYSSVYIDYLATDKPIAFAIEDIEQYESDRGFTFENPLSHMPGTIVLEKDNLLEFLKNVSDGKDNYKEARAAARLELNVFQDDRNTKRVVEYVFGTK